jgi:hypothetical protein
MNLTQGVWFPAQLFNDGVGAFEPKMRAQTQAPKLRVNSVQYFHVLGEQLLQELKIFIRRLGRIAQPSTQRIDFVAAEPGRHSLTIQLAMTKW